MFVRAWLAFGLAFAFASAAAAGTIRGTIRAADTSVALGGKVVAAYDTTGTLAGTATSDATGVYVLTLPAGSYRVLAYDLDGVYATMFDGNAESFETSPLTTIGTTDTVQRDFNLVAGGTISGTVTTAGGTPRADAVVEAYNLSGTRRGFTTTNEQGQFSIVLPPGEYKLLAFDSTAQFSFSFYRDAIAFADAAPITVRAAQASAATFRLPLAGRITGGVTDAATGLPLNGITVYAYTAAGALVTKTTTNANGSFAFSLPPGSYRIVAADPSRHFATGFGGNTNAFSTSTVINLSAAGQGGAQISLAPAATIAGRVVDAAGAPVANVTAAAYNLDGTLHSSVLTEADGTYELLVAPGTYKLVVFDAQAVYATRFFGGARGFAATSALGVASGQSLRGFDFSILRGGIVTGTVREGSTARAGITVAAYDSAGTLVATAITDANGVYRFVVPPGDYRIVAFDVDLRYAPSYDLGANSFDQTVPRTVSAGGTVTADISLRGGIAVAGDVLDANGHGLSGVNVFALDAAGNRVAGGVASNGTFAFAVPAGTYKFVAVDGAGRYGVTYWQHARTLAAAEWVSVSAQTPRITFVLEPALRRRAARH